MSGLQRIAVAFAISTIFSCSTAPSPTASVDDQSSNAPYTVLVVSQRTADTDCPDSGVDIHSGFDGNGNGTLDTDEISETYTVCHGIQASNTLVIITDGAPSESCLYSGKTIQFGLDANADDTLGETEIYQTEYLCNAFGSLLTVTDLDANHAECTYGGRQITSGIDLNENSFLEAGEVNSTIYLCDDPEQLTTTVSEPSGTNCYYGGEAIHTGFDANQDGELTEPEYESTSYVCERYNNLVRTFTCNVDLSAITADPSDKVLVSYRLDEFANYDITVTGKVFTDELGVSTTENWAPYVHEEKWSAGQIDLVYDILGTPNLGTWQMAIDRDVSESQSIPLRLNPDNTQLAITYTDTDSAQVLGGTIMMSACPLAILD